MRLVELIWVDSCSHKPPNFAWLPKEEAAEWGTDGAICRTSGYLVEKNKRGYVIAASVGDNGMVGGLWFVPHGCVRSAAYLTSGKARKRARRARRTR